MLLNWLLVFISRLLGGGDVSKFSGGTNLVDPKGFMNGKIAIPSNHVLTVSNCFVLALLKYC